MQTRTIAPDRYKSFFDSLSRIYQGSSATLEFIAEEGCQAFGIVPGEHFCTTRDFSTSPAIRRP